MNELTQRGIAALKAGDRAAARKYLQAAVKQAPDDVVAWLWLSGAVESDSERITILRHVLRIDPGNQAATRGLSQVLARTPQAPEAAPSGDSASRAPAASADQPESVQGNPISAPASPDNAAIPAGENSQPDATQAAAILAAKRRKKEVNESIDQIIFRTRPSLVQALVTFWLFFFGTLAIGFILSGVPGLSNETILLYTLVVGLVFELIVLYVVIRRYRTRYTLSNQYLTMPFHGKSVKIHVTDILGVECRQSLIQKILSIGDVDINSVAAGELAHLRMRDIPDCQKRTEQIHSFVQDSLI